MSKTVYLICGFKGMGKDYLLANSMDYYCSVNGIDSINGITCKLKDAVHLKFAQYLRDNVCTKVFGKTLSDIEYEKCKDLKLSKSDLTLRDHFKITASELLNRDKYFFARKVCDQIHMSKAREFVVTDFRYLHEYELVSSYFKVVTIRVHRCGVNVDLSHPSENSLLAFNPDIILLTRDGYDDDIRSYNSYYLLPLS